MREEDIAAGRTLQTTIHAQSHQHSLNRSKLNIIWTTNQNILLFLGRMAILDELHGDTLYDK